MNSFNITSSTFYANPNKITSSYYETNNLNSNIHQKTNYPNYSSYSKMLKPIKPKLPFNFDLPQADIEQIRDENIKLKMEMHKMHYNYNIMKVDFQKVENDNKKAMTLLEEVLVRAGVKTEELGSLVNSLNFNSNTNSNTLNLPEICNNNINNQLEKDYISDQELNNNNNNTNNNLNNNLHLTLEGEQSIKDTYINMQLKNQIYYMRRQNCFLQKEINELRQNEKVSAYSKSQQELSKKNLELSHLRECFVKLKSSLEETENKNSILDSEKESLRTTMTKLKSNNEFLLEKLKEKECESERKTNDKSTGVKSNYRQKKGELRSLNFSSQKQSTYNNTANELSRKSNIPMTNNNNINNDNRINSTNNKTNTVVQSTNTGKTQEHSNQKNIKKGSNNSNANNNQNNVNIINNNIIELERLEKALKQEKNKTQKLEKENKELKTVLLETKQSREKIEKTEQDLNKTLKITVEEHKHIKSKYKLLEEELKESEGQNREFDRRFTDVNEAKMKIEFDYKTLQEEVLKLKETNASKVLQKQEEESALTKKIKALEQENKTLKEQVKSLEKAILELEGKNEEKSNNKSNNENTLTKIEETHSLQKPGTERELKLKESKSNEKEKFKNNAHLQNEEPTPDTNSIIKSKAQAATGEEDLIKKATINEKTLEEKREEKIKQVNNLNNDENSSNVEDSFSKDRDPEKRIHNKLSSKKNNKQHSFKQQNNNNNNFNTPEALNPIDELENPRINELVLQDSSKKVKRFDSDKNSVNSPMNINSKHRLSKDSNVILKDLPINQTLNNNNSNARNVHFSNANIDNPEFIPAFNADIKDRRASETENNIQNQNNNTILTNDNNMSLSDAEGDRSKNNNNSANKIYVTDPLVPQSQTNQSIPNNLVANTSKADTKNLNQPKTKKKFTIINEETEDENAFQKKKTLTKIEEIKSENIYPIHKIKSSGLTRKANYAISVKQSSEQVINPSENYYVLDKSFDLNSQTSKLKKPNSTKPSFQKLPTLDKVLTEKIINQDFDSLLQDPQMQKLFNKHNINLIDDK